MGIRIDDHGSAARNDVLGKPLFSWIYYLSILLLLNLVFEGATLSSLIKVSITEKGSSGIYDTNSTKGHKQHAGPNSSENNTMTDPKNQWIPSDAWIEGCVQRQYDSNKELLYAPYEVKWVRYRLGDCILERCRYCRDNMAVSSNLMSIAGEYWRHVCHENDNGDQYDSQGGNLTFLNELFDRYKLNPHPYNETWQRPEDDELVIHLRIGDIMDLPKYVGNDTSVNQMLRDGHDTRHGPRAYYPNGIRSISQYLSIIRESGLTKVVLKGGSHKAEVYPNSRIYSQCLADAIRSAGFNLTTFRVDGEDNPDQDFYYMSHAKHFVRSTGGYSHLISRLVEKRGGRCWNYVSLQSNIEAL